MLFNTLHIRLLHLFFVVVGHLLYLSHARVMSTVSSFFSRQGPFLLFALPRALCVITFQTHEECNSLAFLESHWMRVCSNGRIFWILWVRSKGLDVVSENCIPRQWDCAHSFVKLSFRLSYCMHTVHTGIPATPIMPDEVIIYVMKDLSKNLKSF